MSVAYHCDYCGYEIEDGYYATIEVRGSVPSDGVLGYDRLNQHYGHYHTRPLGDGESCLERVENAFWLAHATGPSLERIPVISGQAVAARRRRHKRGE